MIVHLFGRRLRLLHRFKSRKNRIYLVESEEGRYVLKLYRAPHHLCSGVEYRVLRKAHRKRTAVPQPLAFAGGRALLMEYIPGENLCDLLNRHCLPEYADQLAQWFGSFHQLFEEPGGTTLLRGDSNLRNFLIHRAGGLYGIDLEEAERGDPARDIGQICASILNTDPMFTKQKFALCRRLISCYGRITERDDLELSVTGQIARALRETSRHRPGQRRYLLRQARLLERKGLDRAARGKGQPGCRW